MLNNYLKLAWRNLTKSKTYGFINIFGLAAGMLCSLYIILYVQDQYSYDKYFADAKDLYRLTTIWTVQEDKGNWATVTGPVAPAMKKDFAEVADYARVVPAVGIDHHILQYRNKSFYEKDGVYADPDFFTLFDLHFDHGDPRTALAAPYSVVLMKGIADKLFGMEDPLGKVIQMDNAFGKHDFTVGGVVDERSGKSHIHADFFMSMNSGGYGEFISHNNSWAGNNFVISYVKLRPNTNVAELEKKLPAFLDKYGQKQLKEVGMKKELHLQPIGDIHTTPGFRGVELSRPVSPKFLSILVLIAAMIQVIACINFMNLSTARAAKRAKEVGVRKVIGAQRKDLVRQFLGESFLLSLLGVVIAVPALALLLPFFNSITGADIALGMLLDSSILLLLGALVGFTGLVAGSYPAFYLSAFQAIRVIKGNFTNHISATGIRRGLVVFQFVLSIVLIAGIIVIFSQLNYMKNKDLGYDKEQKIAFSFYTNDAVENIPAFVNHLRGLAGVKSVCRANNYPGQPVLYDNHFFLAGGNITTAPDASLISADENFVRTAGIRMAGGRDLRANDSGRILINESMAKKLGMRPEKSEGVILHSQFNGQDVSYEIAGVIRDYNFSSLHEEVKPLVIQYSPRPGTEVFISARSANFPALLAAIGAIWHTDVPGVPFEYAFSDEEAQKQYAAEITLSKIIDSFTLMAIVISSLGLFGLAAFSAEQRIKEIGVRKVLGASVLDLASLLSKDFFILVGIAIVIATPIAWWAMSSWLDAFAYRTPIRGWMFALAGAVAMLIAMVTVSSQAVRAAMANPVRSLRNE
ncbi:MAG TPA: ABC transporter permease [Puia sp.]|uniref:ABC transporter permease n=1 Tax=Puia sp. TaxID=2045100 RepID=UPI002C9C6CD8|nr:ABC transporter permease [Puia sp.]HVU98111.1 ABC transporter permease [Puia sp.]